jgi:hypothetical protein
MDYRSNRRNVYDVNILNEPVRHHVTTDGNSHLFDTSPIRMQPLPPFEGDMPHIRGGGSGGVITIESGSRGDISISGRSF